MDSYQKFLKDTEDFIFIENKPQKADIIFVPGNGYPHMAENAASLYKEGFAPRILPSGKFSVTLGRFSGVLKKAERYQGDFETEWEFLRHVLIQNGVDQQSILKEDKATFTWENALFSRQVTDAAGISVKKAILCCKSYHARRVLMYYKKAYPETEFFVCPSYPDNVNRNNWRETEEGITEVLGEVSRIVTQFSLMMK